MCNVPLINWFWRSLINYSSHFLKHRRNKLHKCPTSILPIKCDCLAADWRFEYGYGNGWMKQTPNKNTNMILPARPSFTISPATAIHSQCFKRRGVYWFLHTYIHRCMHNPPCLVQSSRPKNQTTFHGQYNWECKGVFIYCKKKYRQYYYKFILSQQRRFCCAVVDQNIHTLPVCLLLGSSEQAPPRQTAIDLQELPPYRILYFVRLILRYNPTCTQGLSYCVPIAHLSWMKSAPCPRPSTSHFITYSRPDVSTRSTTSTDRRRGATIPTWIEWHTVANVPEDDVFAMVNFLSA